MDTDVYFIEENTIDVMLAQLRATPDLFGIGVRQTWDGVTEIPAELHAAIYHSRLLTGLPA